MIHTICGELAPEELGFCQSHEHLLLSKGVSFIRNPSLLMDDEEKSRKELADYASLGGNALVEAQPVGCNRVAEGLLRLSEETGVHIIASTGFHKMIFYPEEHWIFSFDEDRLSDIFIHELTCGMYTDGDSALPSRDIPAKAGQIKCAIDAGKLTPQYEKLFLAAGRASRLTGAPVMVHTEKNSDPAGLMEFLEKNGICPAHLIFCHMDRTFADIGLHKEMASCGIYMEYDTIGRLKYHSDEKELEIFVEMIASGYEDLLLASLDTTRARLKTYTPDGVGLTYILESFLPAMHACGITEAQTEQIFRKNPARAFSFV